MKSQLLEDRKNEANLAFNNHCKAWEELVRIKDPSIKDIEKWIVAREELYLKQKVFEETLREIYS